MASPRQRRPSTLPMDNVDEMFSESAGTLHLLATDFALGGNGSKQQHHHHHTVGGGRVAGSAAVSLEGMRTASTKIWRVRGTELLKVPLDRSAVFTSGDVFATLIECAAACLLYVWVGSGVDDAILSDLTTPESSEVVAICEGAKRFMAAEVPSKSCASLRAFVVREGQEPSLLLAALLHSRSGLVVLRGAWKDHCGNHSRIFEVRDSVTCPDKGAVIAMECSPGNVVAIMPSKSYIVTAGGKASFYLHMEGEGLMVKALGERISRHTSAILGSKKGKGVAASGSQLRHLHVRTNANPPSAFWQSMGISAAPPWPSPRRVRAARLFSVSADGVVCEVGLGGTFHQRHLYPNTCCLLDGGGKEVFMWVGKRAEARCMHLAAKLVLAYAQRLGSDVSVVGVESSLETFSFIDCFCCWDYNCGGNSRPRRPPSSGTVDVGALTVASPDEGGRVQRTLDGLEFSSISGEVEGVQGSNSAQLELPAGRLQLSPVPVANEGRDLRGLSPLNEEEEEVNDDAGWSPAELVHGDIQGLSPGLGGRRRLFERPDFDDSGPLDSLGLVSDDEDDEDDPFEAVDRAHEIEKARNSARMGQLGSSGAQGRSLERIPSILLAVERARSMLAPERPPRTRSFRVSVGVHLAMNQMRSEAQKVTEIQASPAVKERSRAPAIPGRARAIAELQSNDDEEDEEEILMQRHRIRRSTIAARSPGFTPPRLEQGLAALRRGSMMRRRSALPSPVPQDPPTPDPFDPESASKRRPSTVVTDPSLQMWASWRPGPAFDYAINPPIDFSAGSETVVMEVQQWCLKALESDAATVSLGSGEECQGGGLSDIFAELHPELPLL